MTWDKTKPAGNLAPSVGDDAIRANNEHLELALGAEHDFPGSATAGARRHKFPRGNAASRDALTGMVAGSIFLRSDVAGIDVYDGAAWVEYAMTPSGVIVMWSGAIGSIPAGWALCDGTSGTPDLRGRFIVGYFSGGDTDGDYGTMGDTGGEKKHALADTELPPMASGGTHAHTVPFTGDAPVVTAAGGNAAATQNHTHAISGDGAHTHTYTGTGAAHENRPPYFVLAFIMKL